MKNYWLASSAVVCVVLATFTVRAALSVAIDANPATPGIQASRAVAPGEDFSVDIVFALAGTTSLSSYGVSVEFNNLELALNPEGSAATELLPAPFSLNLTAGVASESNANGEVLTFEASHPFFGGASVTVTLTWMESSMRPYNGKRAAGHQESRTHSARCV